ncbi:NUDIX domain-containing protein [Cellulomonas cellasea]|uniref:ADP-ribose pyrophosphatase n=2 Tax=Cellulomonas cellasea TaxID=43670 RepID=A0A0A0BCG5_9CELL|nr:NUDIX hydrolase [Cellulomonas cellasea]KGM03021.1 ADP-ribose pyrophosphatase [Cellulomonas cellasea DSM 20118]GEA90185.1 NUDIX hydrolase [Cellulomonas cellasea]
MTSTEPRAGDDQDLTEVADRAAPRPVTEHTLIHEGRVWDLVGDVVDLGETQVLREYVDHPGAVAVIAVDDEDRVLLLRQYRHPVRSELWEPPAGLRDVADEPPVRTAARELAEEADLRAERWHALVDFYTTPGGSSEEILVFLARGLSPVPDDERFERTDEEAGMVPVWVPLDDAVAAVLAGRLRSPSAVVGILAAAAARARGWDELTPADAAP